MTRAVAIVGAGPAGLMAAEVAAAAGAQVTVYDRMRLPGRKFLLAGRGGLNLTHAEPLPAFLQRYAVGADRLAPLIAGFDPPALRAWADGLGAETFVGSSGRVFPKAMKASPLLRAWLARLAGLGVRFVGGARLADVDANAATFVSAGGPFTVTTHPLILALGGASWPELGSDGGWVTPLQARGVGVTPLAASNAGVLVPWTDDVAALAGQSLKHVAVIVGSARFAGEVMLTARGLEGQAIYAAGAAIRKHQGDAAMIALDLQPNRTEADLTARLAARDTRRTLSAFLQKSCGLSAPSARLALSQFALRDPLALARRIKSCPLDVRGLAPVARAISTAGGIAWEGVRDDLSLKALPGVFVCGEMLDWDAPTGGYLLQACFATGVAAARGAIGRW